MTTPTTFTTPITLQQWESYLPTAFDNELTILNKVNKMIKVLTDIITYLNNGGTIPDGYGNGDVTALTDQVNDLLDRLTKQETMWKQVNGSPSAAAGESVYMPNDSNLFGYMADGQTKPNGDNWLNIGTVEQNSIILLGDFFNFFNGVGQPLWIEANTYVSMRGQNSPSYQKLDANGNTVDPGRTIKHQGNSSYHFIGFANGDQTLPVNTYSTLNTITTVNLQFPPSSWDGTGYLIPRNGVYAFDVKVKIDQAVTRAGSIRFALYIVHSDNSTTQSDIVDVDYNGSYATPFKGTSFQYALSLGDRVYIQVKPLTDALTIGNGSQIHIYGLGDTIQS